MIRNLLLSRHPRLREGRENLHGRRKIKNPAKEKATFNTSPLTHLPSFELPQGKPSTLEDLWLLQIWSVTLPILQLAYGVMDLSIFSHRLFRYPNNLQLRERSRLKQILQVIFLFESTSRMVINTSSIIKRDVNHLRSVVFWFGDEGRDFRELTDPVTRASTLSRRKRYLLVDWNLYNQEWWEMFEGAELKLWWRLDKQLGWSSVLSPTLRNWFLLIESSKDDSSFVTCNKFQIASVFLFPPIHSFSCSLGKPHQVLLSEIA